MTGRKGGEATVLNEISNGPNDIRPNKRNRASASVAPSFAHGAIRRITVEHFLTYTAVDFCPRNNLNLIVGPNGTGKSTIVCAICLGLAGKPGMLGRAVHVTDYIQHGFDKATVEIELNNEDGDNWVIKREIHRHSPSTWAVNNRSSTVKCVKDLVHKLNIQLGNLCQFLPQDKVIDFVKMTPVEILENTEKSVGTAEMFNWHCLLKNLRGQTRELEKSERKNSVLLEQEMQRHKQLEEEVKNYNEREKFLQLIQVLKIKRKWLEYDIVREAYLEKRHKKEVIRTEKKALSVQTEPLRKKAEAAVAVVSRINIAINNLISLVHDREEKINLKVNRMEGFSEKVANIGQALKEKRQDEKQRVKRVDELKKQLQTLEQELHALQDNDSEMIQRLLSEVCRDLENINRALNSINVDKENARLSRIACERKLQDTEREKQRIADVGAKRLEILRQRNPHAYQAVLWLRENRDKFAKPIHEPIMLTISVHDIKDAKYVEAQIPYNDMTLFVCEDKDDFDAFMKVVKDEKNLRINAGIAPDRPLESYEPRRKIETLRKYGVKDYVKNLFSAPEGVMRYLCDYCNVHEVPVGSKDLEDNIERFLRETGFSKVYTPNRLYSCRKSRHNDKIRSTLSSNISTPWILTISIDNKKLAELKSSQKSTIKEIESLKKECSDLDAQERELHLKQEELRNKKKELNRHKGLAARIKQKQEVLQKAESSTIDLEAEERKTAVAISKLNAERLGILKDVTTLKKEILKVSRENTRRAFDHAKAVDNKRMFEKEYEHSTTQLKKLEVDMVNVTEEMKRTKIEGRRLMIIAKAATGLAEDEALSEAQLMEFSTLPQTIETIDIQVDEEQAKADCMNITDENVIRDYQKRKETIGRVENDLQVDQTKLRTLQEEIDRIKELWLPPLESLLDNINKNFSKYFQELGCAGEVSLKKGENPEDFEKYGIGIRVKFRASSELRELTNTHQSGGEKSVATVLYLLSLLELTNVPFRCVDEINQGMDSANERKVFDLIVKTACSRTASQYFLLTPKLLPDLSYSPNMAIHFIHNGPLVKNIQWNVKKFLKKEKRLGQSSQNQD